MTQFSLASVASPTAAQLTAFKEFASVNAGTDALLTAMLTRAMLAVQEWEDVALLGATATLVVSRDEPRDPVVLYLTPGTITSATNEVTGEALQYTRVGKMLIPSYRAAAVKVVYSVVPAADDVTRLMPKVYRYATALYDGESSSTLARILQER